MNKKVRLIAIMILALIFAPDIRAQRTARGVSLVSVSCVSDFTSAGAEVSYGRYLLYSYMAGGVSVNHNGVTASTGEETVFLRAEAFYDWLWRFYSTRDRKVNAYLGGDVFAGLESLDPYGKLASDTYQGLLNNGYTASSFIYGFSPRVECEFFLTPYLGLTATGRVPITLGSQRSLPLGCFSATLSIGARVIF